jgi:hypothetical protein
MTTEEELYEQLQTNFENPSAAEVDGVVARQHSLKDQMAYVEWKKAQDNNPLDTARVFGPRISRFKKPSALGE